MGLTTGSATNLLAIARASSATYFDTAGLMQTAASDALRSTCDPSAADVDEPTLKARLGGAFDQACASQVLTFSEDASDASWTKGLLSITSNAATDPTGGSGMDNLIATAVSGDHRIFKSVTPTSGLPYFFSCFAKANGIQSVQLYSNVGLIIDPTFNVATGTLTTQPNGQSAVIPLGDDVYRLAAYNTAASSTSTNMQIRLVSGGSTTFTGNGSDGLLVWGINLTQTNNLLPYIPRTSATAASTSADVVTLPVASVTPWSDLHGVLEISARTPIGNFANNVVFQIDDGSENNRVRIVRDTSRALRCIVTVASAEQCNISLGTVADNTDFSVAFSWEANDFAASLDGGAATTDTSGTIPSGLTTMRFGHSFTGEHWNSTIKTLLYRPS